MAYKPLDVKTRNTNWINEYMRSYVVYGVKGLFGIFILWLTIEIFKWNIYISHGLSMISTVLITYKGHKSYTFKHNEDGKNWEILYTYTRRRKNENNKKQKTSSMVWL